MRRLTLPAALAIAAAFTASLAACAPNPIVARDPVPAPGPDAAYTCGTRPFVLGAQMTNCEPVLRERQVVVRAKG